MMQINEWNVAAPGAFCRLQQSTLFQCETLGSGYLVAPIFMLSEPLSGPVVHQQAALNLCQDTQFVPRRQDIVTEGNDPDRVHIILRGWAARYKILPDGLRRITAFVLPGDFCHIHATALARMDHSIIALTDCKVAFVRPEDILEISLSTPALIRAFWRSTLIAEAILGRWQVKGGRSDAFEVVAHLLCEWHVRLRLVRLTDDHSFRIPLIQDEIADATGLTPVHVNRTIRQIRERGLATIKDGAIQIHDIEALRKACGFDPRYLHLR